MIGFNDIMEYYYFTSIIKTKINKRSKMIILYNIRIYVSTTQNITLNMSHLKFIFRRKFKNILIYSLI